MKLITGKQTLLHIQDLKNNIFDSSTKILLWVFAKDDGSKELRFIKHNKFGMEAVSRYFWTTPCFDAGQDNYSTINIQSFDELIEWIESRVSVGDEFYVLHDQQDLLNFLIGRYAKCN